MVLLRHIVMFWLKNRDLQVANHAVSLLKSMEGKIEGLISIEAGVDVTGDERSCDICLNCLFTDKDALTRYRTHSVHLPVQAHMHQIRNRSSSADYEVW